MEDILALDDGQEDEKPFNSVASISRFNDLIYLTYLSPMVRAMVNEPVAETIRQLHPLRTQRYMLSDLNPFMWPFKFLAPAIVENRVGLSEENVFKEWEKQMSSFVVSSLEIYQQSRDQMLEAMFKLTYENCWMQALFPDNKTENDDHIRADESPEDTIENELWRKKMQSGGFEAAVIRIVQVISAADKSVDQREYIAASEIFKNNTRLKKLNHIELKRLVKEQAALVEHNGEDAINSLPHLLRTKTQRKEALKIANSIAFADLNIDKREQVTLDRIKKVLEL